MKHRAVYQINRFITKNSSTILTCFAVGGVVATGALSGWAAVKSKDILKKKTEEKGEPLTKKEKVKAVAPVVACPVAAGLVTTACIVGAHNIDAHKIAGLTTGLTLAQNSLKEYKEVTKDICGGEKAEEIDKKISEKHIADITKAREQAEVSKDGGDILFIEKDTGRRFICSESTMMAAERELNRTFQLRGYVDLNFWYRYLGIKESDYGGTVGWNMDCDEHEGFSWIDIAFMKIDDKTYEYRFPLAPSPHFMDYFGGY